MNPMKSVTFVLALGVTVLAAWKLLKHSGDPWPAFPWYGMIAVSYAGGFLIGRVLGRALKTVAVVTAIVLGGLTLLRWTHVDTSKTAEQANAGVAWVRKEAKQLKHSLVHLLPCAGAATVGVFAGRRLRGGVPTNSAAEDAEGNFKR